MNGAIVCPSCDGEGEVGSFCGHETIESCFWCAGKGMVKSLNRQIHRKNCVICGGEGCAGGCDWKGFREWESYELWNSPANAEQCRPEAESNH